VRDQVFEPVRWVQEDIWTFLFGPTSHCGIWTFLYLNIPLF
jgi:hypothetical protein